MSASEWMVEPLHVLVVEDDEVDAIAIRRALQRSRRARFKIHHVRYATEAYRWLDANTADVALLDLALPDASGLEGVMRFQARAGRMPVVVLTGQDDEALASRLFAAGIQDYIVKGREHMALLERSLRYAVERQRNWDQIRKMQRIESLGHLAGGVAHDFNNMLSIILGNLELLRASPRLGEELDRIDTIIKATERSADLTHKLLAFGRKQTLQPRILIAGDIFAEARALLSSVVGEEIELRVEVEAGTWPIKADPTEIQQAIMNLALNARDAMPCGGYLTLRARNSSVDEPLAAELQIKPGEYCCLEVMDSGSGIPEAVLGRIFDPFFTTKDIKGTGLGLSMVFGTVRQSGGGLRVETAEGQGTTFSVYLPRFVTSEGLRPSGLLPSLPSARRYDQTRVILVIEDEADLRSMVHEMLEIQGYRVLEAADGDEALRIFDLQGQSIDLVLSDVVMPGRSGPEVIEAILDRSPRTKVAYMTGYDDEKLSRRGLILEESWILKKPFTMSALRTMVREILQQVAA